MTDYAEDRAALRPAMVLLGVGMPTIAVVTTVLGAVTGRDLYLMPAAIAIFVWIFSGAKYVFVGWPSGIRIDRVGVRIGNVRRPDADWRRPPAPSFQAYRVFAVSWADVLSIRVTRDRRELRQLRRTSRRARGRAVGFQLGMLEHATFPESGYARLRSAPGRAPGSRPLGGRNGWLPSSTRSPTRRSGSPAGRADHHDLPGRVRSSACGS